MKESQFVEGGTSQIGSPNVVRLLPLWGKNLIANASEDFDQIRANLILFDNHNTVAYMYCDVPEELLVISVFPGVEMKPLDMSVMF